MATVGVRIDLRNIYTLAVNAPGDEFWSNPMYHASGLAETLRDSGINPVVFFSTIKALVYDYGFNIDAAFELLKNVMTMNVIDMDNYISRAVFTIARKIGYSQYNEQSLQDLLTAIYTMKVVSFESIIKPVTIGQGAPTLTRPFGPIRFNPPQFVAGIPATKWSLYNDGHDINILLMDGNGLSLPYLKSDSIANKRFRLIVSDRSKEGEYDQIIQRENNSNSGYKQYKRARKRIGDVFSKLGIEEQENMSDDFYQLPEWNPIILARREGRIRWMIEKVVRTWRLKKITAKRESLWNAGYVPQVYDRVTMTWSQGNIYDTSILQNWIREKTANIYDTKILKPVYEETINALQRMVHTSYPVTDDELGFFLQEWLDITWEETLDEKKLTYAITLSNLLRKYRFTTAVKYFAKWLVVNGITDINPPPPPLPAAPPAPIEANWANMRTHIETIIPSKIPPGLRNAPGGFGARAAGTGAYASGIIPNDFTRKLTKCTMFVFEFEDDDETRIPTLYTDQWFFESVTEYMDARSDALELTEIENFPKSDLVTTAIKAIALDLISGAYNHIPVAGNPPVILPGFALYNYTDIAGNAQTGHYSTFTYDFYKRLPEILNFATLSTTDVNTMQDYRTSPLLQEMNAEITAIGYRRGGGGPVLDLQAVLNRMINDQNRTAAMMQFILLNTFAPILGRVLQTREEIEDRIEVSRRRTDIFFSGDHMRKAMSVTGRSVDEDEIIDTIMQFDGLSLDRNSASRANILSNCRDRVITLKGPTEAVVEIEPTVEYSAFRADKYLYTVKFVNLNGTERSIYLDDPSQYQSRKMSVPIYYGETGYIHCTIKTSTGIRTVEQYGEMPIVRVSRELKSVRSGNTFTDKNAERRYIGIVMPSAHGVPATLTGEMGSGDRNVRWEYNHVENSIGRLLGKFESFAYTLFEIEQLFKFCIIVHKSKDWSVAGSRFFYRKLWYNGSGINKKVVTSAMEMSTSPYKEIVLLNRLDLNAQHEIDQKINKKKLKTYKKLFMIDEFNSVYEVASKEPDFVQNFHEVTTMNMLTAYSMEIETIYKHDTDTEYAGYIAMTKLPYLLTLNFIACTLGAITGDNVETFYPCYPELFKRESDALIKIEFAKECVNEVLGRMYMLFANMSLRKDAADKDHDMTNSTAFQFEKLMVMSWRELVDSAPFLPKDLAVFEQMKREGVDYYSREMQTSYDPDMIGFSIAFGSLKRGIAYYESLYTQSRESVDGRKINDKRYIGFESHDRVVPYFIEITDEAGLPLRQLPNATVQLFLALDEGFRYLRFGDRIVGMEQYMEGLEKEITILFNDLTKSINFQARTANVDIMKELTNKCKVYNRLLL